MFSQCGTESCSLCDITARITSVSGGDIVINSAAISGNVNGGQTITSDQPLEVNSTSCGELKISIELDFNWDQGSKNNWIHGVSFKASPNWLAAQGVIIPANNGWLFRNSITGVCSSNSYGAGYYWDPPGKTCGSNQSNYNGWTCVQGVTNCEENNSFLVDGDPSDNYGINCDTDCPNFGFELAYCPVDAGSNVEVLTFILTEDGESGGWARSDNCIFTLNFPLKINSAGLQIPNFNPIVCLDSCIILDAGIGCDQYLWSTGDTTSSIEVCPIIPSQYGVTVIAATGCEIIDTIDVGIENCCKAESGSFDVADDTLFICPFEMPLITVNHSQTQVGYENRIIIIKDGIEQTTLDTVIQFNPGQYQFNHVNQCDTFIVYSLNTYSPATDSLPVEGISDLISNCYDLDSLVVIIRDDDPPISNYPYTDSITHSDNIIIIKYLDTIACISDLQDAPILTWTDDCLIREVQLIEQDSLIPCELSYAGKLWIATDHCSNTTIIRNWTTLFPDTITFDVMITNEYCLGENNGEIDIININQSDALWSLDDGAFLNKTHFENLSPGQHIIRGKNSCGCVYADTILINQGVDLSIELLDTICNNNGTLGIPDDDFYIASLLVTSNGSDLDSCAIYQDGQFIKNQKFDESFTINIDLVQGFSTIQVFDISKPDCQTFIEIDNLISCSGMCAIEAHILEERCKDNETRGYEKDDFYEIVIQAFPTNTNSDSFSLTNNGEIIYKLPYFTTNTIILPADSFTSNLILIDMIVQGCDTTIATSELIPCSGKCMLFAEVTEIVCNDNETRRNPTDDTWSFSITGELKDGTNTIRIQSGLNYGYFESGDTITFSDIPIDSPFIELVLEDSILLDCDTLIKVFAPLPCSNCLANITLETEEENCELNEDGSVWVTFDQDTLINLEVDNKDYQNGSQSLSSGNHTLSILYGDSCKIDTFFNIGSRQEFMIDVPEEYVVTYPNKINLQAETDLDITDIIEISWNPSFGLDCDDCLDPEFDGDASTQYIISVEDIYGCIISNTTKVVVNREPKIYFPNIISIHSQVNNIIYPIANFDNTIIDKMAIYDRWGNLVFLNKGFKPNDPASGWDGKVNGNIVASGVYLYHCNVTNKDGEKENFVGTVTVVR